MAEKKSGVAFSFDGRSDKVKPKGPLDSRSLKEAKQFTVVFSDGKTMKAHLLEIDSYNLLVESGGNRLLIPKHSIKCVLLS